MWFLALFSVVGSFVLVGLSVFPGVLEQIPTSITRSLGGAFGLFATGASSWHLIRPTSPGRTRQRKSALVVLFCLAATPALLLTSTPRWLAFSRHQPRFEALLSQAPPPGNRAVVPLNADLNVYWIDHWGPTPAVGRTSARCPGAWTAGPTEDHSGSLTSRTRRGRRSATIGTN